MLKDGALSETARKAIAGMMKLASKLLLEKEKITRSEFEALFEDGVSEEG